MTLLSSLLVTLFFSTGFYLMMRRNVFEILLGATFMSYATFVLLLTLSGWSADTVPPFVPEKDYTLVKSSEPLIEGETTAEKFQDEAKPFNPVDPLPQALILTAIVINFGVTGFLIILVARGVQETNSIEFSELPREEDEL